MDHLFLEAVSRELAGRLAGGRIDKIHQPDAETIVMRVWNGRESLRLVLGFAAGRARLHLTEQRPVNPFTPLRFCQLLRARLGRIEEVDKTAHERSVRIRCRGRAGEAYLLIADFFGAQANLLLVDEAGIVIDALRRSCGGREAVPGCRYEEPAAETLRYFLADPLPDFPADVAVAQFFEQWLLRRIVPISPLIARDLAAAVAAGGDPRIVLEEFRRQWLAKKVQPAVLRLDGQTVLTAFLPMHLEVAETLRFDTPSAAAEYYFAAAGPGFAAADDLQRIIGRALKRLRMRLTKIEADLIGVDEGMANRQAGELLLVNLHRVRRGMSEIVVDNYFADPPDPLTIRLDPKWSPQENAERYFRSYKKKQRGREHAERRLAETRREIEWVEELAHFLDEAQTAAEIEEIRRELVAARLMAAPAGKGVRKLSDVRDTLQRGRTPGGFQLWWGKSSRSNEYVSRELTAPDDLWFHAHRIPGCHLVLKRAGRPEIPLADQIFAAAIAAGYSRGKAEGKIEVIVTEGKNVRKPKGSRAGLVTVERFRTLLVAPRRLDHPGS